jgi:hypothetical protein
MKKLKLAVETLRVVSFETGSQTGRRGMVHANSFTFPNCSQSAVTLCGTCAGDLGCPPSEPAREDQ